MGVDTRSTWSRIAAVAVVAVVVVSVVAAGGVGDALAASAPTTAEAPAVRPTANAPSSLSAAALSSGDWPTGGHDANNSGYSPTATGPTADPAARWVLDVAGDDYAGDTVVADGTVYVGGHTGVRAVNATTGRVDWNTTQFEAGGLAVAGGTVYVTGERDSDPLVAAFDASDGTELWNDTLRYVDVQTPRVVDGTLFVDYETRVRAYDAATGAFLWNSDAYGDAATGGIAVADDTVYLPTRTGSASLYALVALNASDGGERWRFDVDGRMVMTPSAVDGTVYLGVGDEDGLAGPDPRLYALDATDGGIEWVYDSHARPNGVAVGDGRVYAATGNTLRALDEATGAEQWSFATGGYDYYGSTANPPAAGGGVVYVSNDRGDVYGVDAATGSEQWHYDTSGRPESPVLAGDTLYVRVRDPDTSGGSRVLALEENPLSFSGLAAATRTAAPGETVTVDVTVTNDDGVGREYNLSLVDDRPHVGGERAVDSLQGTLAPGASTTLTFTASFGVTGDHDLSVRRARDPASATGTVTVSVAHASPDRDWPVRDGDAARSAADDDGVGAKRVLQEVWNQSGDDNGHAPVVANGTAYLVYKNTYTDQNDVVAYDETTGAERWRYNTSVDDRRITGSPAVADGLVYVTTFPYSYSGAEVGSNATLYALHEADGTVAWTTTLAIDEGYASGYGNDDTPLVADGTVYVAGSLEEDESVDLGPTDAALYALNASTGGVEWTYAYGSADESENARRLAVGADRVFVQVEDQDVDDQGTRTRTYELHAVDRTSGTLDWRATDVDPGGALLAGDGYVYAANRSGYQEEQRLYAFHAANGTEAWRLDRPTGAYYGSDVDNLALADGSLYVDHVYYESSVRYDTVYKLDPATGAEDWNRSVGDANAMLVVDGLLYAGNVDFSDTYLYDARTGEYLGDSDVGAALAVANGTLYTYLETTAPAGDRFVALREGGEIVLSNTQVSRETSVVGENVTISATATNVGTLPREFDTNLHVSGAHMTDYYSYDGTAGGKERTLAPGESTTVSYVVEFRSRGEFTVAVVPEYHHGYGGSPTQHSLDQYVFDETSHVTVAVGDARDGHAVALTNRSSTVTPDSWPKRGLDDANTGHHDATTGPTAVGSGVAAWNNTDVEYDWTTAPTVADGTVFVGGDDYSSDDHLFAVNATTGDLAWGYESGGELATAPTYADGFVYVADDDRLYAVNTTNHHLLWSYYADGVDGAPTVSDGVLYFGTGGDGGTATVYALNASTRAVLWTAPVQGSVDATPAVVNGTVYVSTYDERVYALDAATGTEVWNETLVSGYDTTSPVVANGTVYVGNSDELAALDAATGDTVWNTSADLSGEENDVPTKPAVADGTVFFGDDAAGQFRAVDAATGADEWQYTLCSPIDGAPAVADDTVYFGANDGYAYALDAATGDTVWHYRAVPGAPSYPLVYAPAVVDGVAYVSTDHGDYYPSLLALTGGTSNASRDPFGLSGLTAPANATAGQAVTVSATVSNAGESTCGYTATLYVDGSAVDQTDVSVSGGDTGTASFSYAFPSAGTYDVRVDDLAPVQVTVSGPEADIDVSPTTRDFGDVDVGDSTQRFVRVDNVGTATLYVTATAISGADAGDFRVVSDQSTIYAGDTAYFWLAFAPSAGGTRTASLDLTSTDPDEPTVSVALTGTGVAPAPNASVSPTSLDFGDVDVGTTATRNVTVTNDGSGPLTFDGVDVAGNGAFAVTAGNGSMTVASGDSHEFTVSFAPTVADTVSATLAVLSDDPDDPSVAVSASGTGVLEPDVGVTPASHDFGDVEVGTSASVNVTVSNDGDANLTVSGATFETLGFSVTAGGPPVVVEPGESHDLSVRFAPVKPGPASGTLSVWTNDPATPVSTVAFAGNGTLTPEPDVAVSPSAVAFGNVSLGDTATRTVTVANTGTAPLNVTDLRLSGPNVSAYAVTASTPFDVVPGSAVNVSLELSPASVGPKSVALAVDSNDTDEPTVVVAEISGYGVDTEPPTVSVAGVDGGYEHGGVAYADETVVVNATADGTPGDAASVAVELRATRSNYVVREPAALEAASGNWTATFDLAGVADDGRYDVRAVAVDESGNENATTAAERVVVDREAPDLAATLSRVDATTARVNVTASEPLRDGTLAVGVDRPNASAVDVSLTDAGNRWTGTFALSEDGQYAVTAAARDRAGNAGSGNATARFETRSTDANNTLTVKMEPSGLFVRFTTDRPVNDTFVTMTESSVPLAPLARGQAGVNFLNAVLGRHLVGNLSYALVGIPADDSLLPPGSDGDDVTIRYFNETSHAWEDVATTREHVALADGTDGDYWVANVSHFSTYGAVVTDTAAPTFDATTPGDGHEYAAGTTGATLRVPYDDALSGVNASQVTVTFEGTDVTDDAETTVTGSYVEYAAAGLANDTSYDLAVTAVDEAGNAATEVLTVSVAAPPTDDGDTGGDGDDGGNDGDTGGNDGGSGGGNYYPPADRQTTTTTPTTTVPTTTVPTTTEPTTRRTTTPTTTDPPTTTDAPASTATTGDGESGGGVPGFGPVLALAALALVALLAARRD